MIIFDAHQDTLIKIKEGKSSLYHNQFHVDFRRISQETVNQYFLCSAIFIHPQKNKHYFKEANQVIDYLESDVLGKRDKDGFLKCNSQVSLVLSLEGAHVLEGNIDNLHHFYERGVRVIGLTWNFSNELAGGCIDPDIGLTKLGISFLQRMEAYHIILDVSHLSTKSFDQVFYYFRGKIIASHSNAYRLCEHQRNLKDEQILKLSKAGGVIGINFYPDFLSKGGRANISHIIEHIEYVAALGGIGSVGLGSDFDGVDKLPEGIRGLEDMHKIVNELEKLNYKREDIQAVMGYNFLQMFKN